MTDKELKDKLMKYFDINNDTYCFHLTRVKEAQAYGTLTIEDFEEFSEDTIDDLIEYIKKP